MGAFHFRWVRLEFHDMLNVDLLIVLVDEQLVFACRDILDANLLVAVVEDPGVEGVTEGVYEEGAEAVTLRIELQEVMGGVRSSQDLNELAVLEANGPYAGIIDLTVQIDFLEAVEVRAVEARVGVDKAILAGLGAVAGCGDGADGCEAVAVRRVFYYEMGGILFHERAPFERYGAIGLGEGVE